jgi:hypothetical protein
MIFIMFLQRRIGIGLDFFSVAWALVLTVFVTRLLGTRIDYERPLGQVIELFRHEVRGPRARTAVGGGSVRFRHVRVSRSATGPAPTRKRRAEMRRAEKRRAQQRRAETRRAWKGRARASG